jgi:hypothetical protein
MRVYHITPLQNLAAIQAEGLRPQIGPRSRDLEEEDAAHVFYDLETLENAILNWDMFDEDEDLICLEIEIELDDVEDDPAYPGAVGLIRNTIPPDSITVSPIAL